MLVTPRKEKKNLYNRGVQNIPTVTIWVLLFNNYNNDLLMSL
jgi:hypothetical protein